MEAQTITLNTQADPSCIVMLSISLLMYDQVGHTGEYILLNNKGFSPCAIIAAYPAEQPAPKTASSISLSIEAYPDRYMKIQEMGYDGNRLMKKLEKQIEKIVIKQPTPPTFKEEPQQVKLRQKISF